MSTSSFELNVQKTFCKNITNINVEEMIFNVFLS